MEIPPAALTVLARSAARPALAEQALVLAAAEIPHDIEFDGHHWLLLVPERYGERALRELIDWQTENQPGPKPTPPRVIDNGLLGALGYLLVIWSLPWIENAGLTPDRWRELGALAAEAVRGGELWRAVTALTLHGDLGHLVANSAFGGTAPLLYQAAGEADRVTWFIVYVTAVIAVSLLVYIFVLKNKSSNWLDDEAGMRSRVRGSQPARDASSADSAAARA